jgi:hypothetical protein
MARHHLTSEAPERDLGKADVVFHIRSGPRRKLIGTLFVSQALIAWQPPRGNKARKLSWSRFHDLTDSHGRRCSGKCSDPAAGR